jgi:hypothetical protein
MFSFVFVDKRVCSGVAHSLVAGDELPMMLDLMLFLGHTPTQVSVAGAR